jgi:hypothetical protein
MRYGDEYITIDTQVEVRVSDIIDEISDSTLLKECLDRKLSTVIYEIPQDHLVSKNLLYSYLCRLTDSNYHIEISELLNKLKRKLI